MNNNLVIFEGAIKKKRSSCLSSPKASNDVALKKGNFLMAVLLHRRMTNCESTVSTFKKFFDSIFGTLDSHTDQINSLLQNIHYLKGKLEETNKKNNELDDRCCRIQEQIADLEQQYSFESLKNRELLEKHERLLHTIEFNKQKWNLVLDLLLFYAAVRIADIRAIRRFFESFSSEKPDTKILPSPGSSSVRLKIAQIAFLLLAYKHLKSKLTRDYLCSQMCFFAEIFKTAKSALCGLFY